MQATSGAKQKVSIQDGEMEQSLNFCLLRAVKAMKFEWRQKEATLNSISQKANGFF